MSLGTRHGCSSRFGLTTQKPMRMHSTVIMFMRRILHLWLSYPAEVTPLKLHHLSPSLTVGSCINKSHIWHSSLRHPWNKVL